MPDRHTSPRFLVSIPEPLNTRFREAVPEKARSRFIRDCIETRLGLNGHEPISTHPRTEQQQWINQLRETLNNLPPDVPDGILDDIVDLTLELQGFIEHQKPGPEPAPYVHLYEREEVMPDA